MTTRTARHTRTRVWIAGAVLLSTAAGFVTPVAATNERSVLRCADPQFRRVVAQGLARSATLRRLVADLEHAHVIAYGAISRELPPGVGGRLRFIGAGDGWRFLRIEVDDRRSKIDLLSLLGHELQHAAEVAGTPDVTDAASMATLYDRIGLGRMRTESWGHPAWYETQAAIDTEHRVYGELFGGRW